VLGWREEFPDIVPSIRQGDVKLLSRFCWQISEKVGFLVGLFLITGYGLTQSVGIRECEIIQWFVEPEARVEEWDKLCEVQSDKASVEITSRFGGVIKKLHYEAGDMAKVGKPLLDIDIQSEVNEKDLAELTGSPVKGDATDSNPVHTNEEPKSSSSIAISSQSNTASSWDSSPRTSTPNENPTATNYKPKGKHASLATPAVRHLTKELKINLADIQGTGREGRVMKEDVHAFARQRAASGSPAQGNLLLG
jgi:2-oxoisovalerate dehydrogenase E2 component (dihydrolipoyl transacylase)